MEITFNKDNLKVVDINEVRVNTWNPKAKKSEDYEKVRKSIRKNGLMQPVVVRENNGYEILDGEQRFTACLDEGFQKILIYNEGVMSDERAKELTIWYQQQVPFDKIDEAYLAYTIKDLIGELPYTDEELKEIEKIVEFDWNTYTVNYELEETDTKQKLMIRTEHFEEVKKFAESLINQEEKDGLEELQIIKVKKITVLNSQAKIINEALQRMKEQGIKPDGRALELICADYLGGLN